MDRYSSKKCLALEDAIDAFGIPSHVEVNDGSLQVTFLGTTQVTLQHVSSGSRIDTPIPDRVTLD